jgi:fatty-acyl-CoA synthase
MPTIGALESTHEAVEREVLGIVASLVAELGGRGSGQPVALDDTLDRDLGIGSLERVELLLRLDQAFGVRLPDAAMAEAVTPRDLVAAVLGAEPAALESLPAWHPPVGAATAAPESASTLVEVLAWHAQAHPERIHIFLRQEDGTEQPISYGALWEQARAVGAGLRTRGIGGGDTVALMLRTEQAFFPAFFGVLLAGAVPVPIYPPFRRDQIEEYARRQVGILGNARARAMITFPQAERVAGLLRSHVPSLRYVLSTGGLALPGASLPTPLLGADDSALVQYTSGSTGAPKGVLLTHSNLLANIRAIGHAVAIAPDDVAVSWLPLYHDMGLIGSWLGALYFGVPIVILSPLAFLSRPARWLWALHAHGGTVSAAPNFAFDLCVRKVGDDEIQGLDLSAWRLALNGSEPVSPDTIERFTRRFAPHGLRPQALRAVYGLAEASVALTIPRPDGPPRIDAVTRESFQRRGEAVPSQPGDPTALRFVSCGPPIRGHEVRVVDASGRPVGDRREGRIEFRGPSVTAGYFRNPSATRAALREGWMDSGDLGYWAESELFVTGRLKDLIIKGGRNLSPQEVEDVVGELPGIRKGCVAAFGVHDPAIGTERLIVVAETRETDPDRRRRLHAAVLDRVVTALGIPPDTVLIADPRTVLKTSSGKVRRGATREAYIRGELGRRVPSRRSQWIRLLAGELRGRLQGAAVRVRELAVGAYVGALLALTMPALWLLVLLLPGARAADRLARHWCRLVLALSGCAIRTEGLEHLEGIGPAVLGANHSSYLDVVALLAALPLDFRFVAKRELVRTPVIGAVIRKAGHLTVERTQVSQSVADAERVTEALRSGLSVCVFPEGTFARPPGILPFRLGAFKSAVETGCPVIPVTIRGTRGILPADEWLPRPGPITVAVGSPLRPEGQGWPAMVGLRDRAREAIARRSGEPLVERLSAS